MLNLKILDGKVYLSSNDWKNITNSESAFLSKCYWSGVIWSETVPGGDLVLNMPCGGATAELATLGKLLDMCHFFEIELPEGYKNLISETTARAEVERKEKERQAEEQKRVDEWTRAISYADSKMRYGCTLCEHLRIRDSRHFCNAAERYCRKREDELEEELYARRESMRTGEPCEFYARAYPCVNCPYVVEGRRALEQRSAWLDAQQNK